LIGWMPTPRMLLNKELLQDIALVPEIQAELRQKSESGIVNSIGVVSSNAYKAVQLKKITDLFLPYGLEPYDYSINKCRPEKIQGEEGTLSMHCALVYVSMLYAPTGEQN
ncbi:MAG: hypothetical protein AAFV25_21005, partial [Bacteroidota bacterium]